MTPEFWRWSAHGQWHPVVRAHPLTRLTFQTAITAPGPPIQTKTPTHKHNGHHCSHTRATLFGPSSFLCPLSPSAPGPILLLILTHSLEEFSVIACSHINEMAMTTGQVPGNALAVREDWIAIDVSFNFLCVFKVTLWWFAYSSITFAWLVLFAFGFVSPIIDNRRHICLVITALSEVLFVTTSVAIYQISECWVGGVN